MFDRSAHPNIHVDGLAIGPVLHGGIMVHLCVSVPLSLVSLFLFAPFILT
jgi:hypothetical protein